jgi:hypothetical protein
MWGTLFAIDGDGPVFMEPKLMFGRLLGPVALPLGM